MPRGSERQYLMSTLNVLAYEHASRINTEGGIAIRGVDGQSTTGQKLPEREMRIIVFANTKKDTVRILRTVRKQGFKNSTCLNSDLWPEVQNKRIADFC